MKAGIPILTTNQPENKRVIDECKCGLLLEEIGPETVAEKIKQIFEDRSAMKRMGRSGRKKFLSKYNWETERKKLDDLLAEII